MTNYIRAFVEKPESETDDPSQPVWFVASTEGIKRDGKDLKTADWLLDNYRRHPVVLFAHDYMGRNLPIGLGEPVTENGQLRIGVRYDTEDEFAMKVRAKALKGMMAGSVGWDDVRVGKEIRHELLEFSNVPVPADPDALPLRQMRALQHELDLLADALGDNRTHRGAIPPHTTEKADENAAWDKSGELSKAEGKEQLRRMHAWVDEEQDTETKQAYKLPHHRASGEVVWRGVAAAMARLLQAGTQIPDADRKGVFNHLSRHYGQFSKEPPEFRTNAELAALGPDEWRGLFLEGEVEMADADIRVGAVLSGRNRTDLEQAITLIQAVLERAKKEEKEAPEPTEDGRESDDERQATTLAGLRDALSRIQLPAT